MQKISNTLLGTFGEKKIEMDIFPVSGSNTVILNIHGVYDSKENILHQNFAQAIQKNNIAHIVLYSSSRSTLPENPEERYQIFQGFLGKNFSEELGDARMVVQDIIHNSELYFSEKNIRIIINGNSLGGTLAFFLASEFPEIIGISTVGTGLRKERGITPLIDTFPEVEIYKKHIQNFTGKYLMHEGDDDAKFSHESFTELFETLSTQNKKRILYKGVNHGFSGIYGEKSEKPYQELYQNFVSYFFS